MIPIEQIQSLDNNSLLEYADPLSYYNHDVCSYISEVIQAIFENHGVGNFTKADTINKTAFSIYLKYQRMPIGVFAVWAKSWLTGNTDQKPTIAVLLADLSRVRYNTDTENKELYNEQEKKKMLYSLWLNRGWIFTEGEKIPIDDIRRAYFMLTEQKTTKDYLYLLAAYSNGVIGENVWPKLIEDFPKWIKEKAKKENHVIIS